MDSISYHGEIYVRSEHMAWRLRTDGWEDPWMWVWETITLDAWDKIVYSKNCEENDE